MNAAILSQEKLKEVLSYDTDTGNFLWLYDSGKAKKGEIAGHKNKSMGYILIGISNQKYLAHRLVWLYTYGKLPANTIDHINRNKHDNRLCNLREATHSENMCNTAITNTVPPPAADR